MPTGTESRFQDMTLLAEALQVNGVAFAPAAQASAITDFTGTGTYATDEPAIETAINSILTVLRDNGLIAT